VAYAGAGVGVIGRETLAVQCRGVANGAQNLAPLLVAERAATVVLVHRHINHGVAAVPRRCRESTYQSSVLDQYDTHVGWAPKPIDPTVCTVKCTG